MVANTYIPIKRMKKKDLSFMGMQLRNGAQERAPLRNLSLL